MSKNQCDPYKQCKSCLYQYQSSQRRFSCNIWFWNVDLSHSTLSTDPLNQLHPSRNYKYESEIDKIVYFGKENKKRKLSFEKKEVKNNNSDIVLKHVLIKMIDMAENFENGQLFEKAIQRSIGNIDRILRFNKDRVRGVTLNLLD